MSPNDEITVSQLLADETFVNYLTGADPRDIAYWKEWIEANPSCRPVIEEARNTHFALRSVLEEAPAGMAGRRSAADVEQFRKWIRSQPAHRGKRVRSMLLYGAAAAAVMLVLLGVWWKHMAPPAAHYRLYASADTAIRKVQLPDGSSVLLNKNASVALEEGFNNKKRLIRLTGSAFFKVAKDATRPFTVNADGVETTALGTEFYVHEDQQERSVTVSLLEGRVRVANGYDMTELIPGQKAICNRTSAIQKAEFLQDQLQQWTAGKVVLNQSDLAEIIGVLRNYYNLSVELKGHPDKMKFTGIFDANHPDELLEALAFAYSIKYSRRGEKLIIYLNKK